MRPLSLFYPTRCVGCGEKTAEIAPGGLFCPVCLEKWRAQKKEICPECGKRQSECRCRFDPRFPYAHLIGYDPAVPGVGTTLLFRMKNKPLPRGTVFPANELAKLLLARGWEKDAVLVFVPRAPYRRRQAGVDQAKELCEGIAKETGLAVVPALKRIRLGKEQKYLSQKERRENAAALYRPDPKTISGVAGKRAILVDDIVTTGSSAAVCGEILLAAGAKSVAVLSVGRTGKETEKT